MVRFFYAEEDAIIEEELLRSAMREDDDRQKRSSKTWPEGERQRIIQGLISALRHCFFPIECRRV